MADPRFEDTAPIESGPSFDDTAPIESLPAYANGSSPETPLNTTPVSAIDHFNMSLGNEAGSISYLKKRFENVTKNKDGDLIIRDKGIYHRVDPKTLQEPDAWSVTKNIVNKIPSMAGPTIDASFATMGGILGGGAASIPGIGAGAAIGETIRTSLGRFVGTYKAEPEEQVKDIAVEALINMGGQKILNGLRPSVPIVAKALSKFVDDAAPGVRQSMAKLLSSTAGTDIENMNRVLSDRVKPTMAVLNEAYRNAGDGGVQSSLKGANLDRTKAMLSGAQKALSSQFASQEDSLLEAVPKSFKLNVGQSVSEALGKLQEMGALERGANGVYRTAADSHLMDFLKHPEGSGAMSAQAIGSLKNFVKLANDMTGAKSLEGKEAVQGLLNVRRTFDKFYYSTIKANPDAMSALTPISSSVRKSLVTAINEVSPEVAAKYSGMNSFYQAKIPFVAKAERVMDNFNAPETFLNQLMQPAGKNELNKQVIKEIAQLKGKGGQVLLDNLKDGIAAHDFIRILPNVSMKSAAIATGAGLATGHLPGLAIGTMMAAPMMSPRAIARTSQGVHAAGAMASDAARAVLPYAEKFGDFIKVATPEQIRQMVTSPETVDSLIRTVMINAEQQGQMTDKLLKQGGVK